MIDFRIENITPLLAKEYLEKNKNNYRSVKKTTVERYAKIMRSGQWKLNGEPICFDKNGNLVNGQHRLKAVISANTPIDFLVVFNVEEDDAYVYDCGANRSISEMAAAKHGKGKNTRTVFGISNMLFDKNYLSSHIPSITNEDLVDLEFEFDEQIQIAINISKNQRSVIPRKVGIACAAFLLLEKRENISLLKEFFEIVHSGVCYDKEKSSAIVIRNMFINNIFKGRNSSPRTENADICSAIIAAFTDYKNGKERRKVYNKTELFSNFVEDFRRDYGL